MCECYKIGGPWIAEDPNCPVHGAAAQHERQVQCSQIDDLQEGLDQVQTLEQMKDLMHEVLNLLRER